MHDQNITMPRVSAIPYRFQAESFHCFLVPALYTSARILKVSVSTTRQRYPNREEGDDRMADFRLL